MKIPLLLALILMGFTFLITQVMVVRELLVIFIGNELSIAIILANWLLLEAAGSFFLGRMTKVFPSPKKAYISLQILVSIFLPLTIYGVRLLRTFMGLTAGEGASFLHIFGWTALILSPLGLIDGSMFAFGCRLLANFRQQGALSIGKVYLLEAVGATIGGLLYTYFFIPFFNSFQVAFVLGAANLLSAHLLLSFPPKASLKEGQKLRYGLWTLLVFNLIILFFSGSRVLEESSLRRQWPGLRVVDSRWSPYGNVLVAGKEEQLTFFSNGVPICNVPVPNISLVEEMVHFSLLFHPFPQKVLVIGGGFGGLVAEILKSPVREVHYTEIDPLIIQLLKEHPTPLTRQEMDHPALKVHNIDGRFFVKMRPNGFDVVILNLPGPVTLELNRFYTVEFFREVKRILNKNGVLTLSAPGSEAYLSPEMRDLNLCLIRTMKEVFPSVYPIPGEVNLILATPDPGAGPPRPEVFVNRLQKRKLSTRLLTEFHIRYKLQESRGKWMEEALMRGKTGALNRDNHPSGLYYEIAFWNAQFHPFLQHFWGTLQDVRLWHLILPLSVLTVILLLFRGKGLAQWERIPLAFTVITTGFFGMAFDVLLIFSFQTLYGYLYHWIGLLLAAFMVGLAMGSWATTRAMNRMENPARFLAQVEAGVILYSVLALALLASLYSASFQGVDPQAWRVVFLFLGSAAGFMVGLEFPLASKLFTRGEGEVGRTAGVLYAADLLGAWAGSLLVGVLLVPVLGILQTCAVIIFLKLASFFFLSASKLRPWGR